MSGMQSSSHYNIKTLSSSPTLSRQSLAMAFSSALMLFALPVYGSGGGPQKCEDFNAYIPTQCSQNPLRMNAEQEKSILEGTAGGLQANNASKAAAESVKAKLSTANLQCAEARKLCKQQCEEEFGAARDNYRIANTMRSQAAQAQNQAEVARQETIAEQEKVKFQKANATFKVCEAQSAQAIAENSIGDIGMTEVAQLTMAGASLLTAAGGLQGQKSASLPESESNNDDENECDGEFAEFLVGCNKASEPIKGTRSASVAGGRVGSLLGNGDGQGLFQSSSQGEPGGESKDGAKERSAPGFAAAGAGGFSGGIGGAGSAITGEEPGQEGLDPNLSKGYISAGGGSGSAGGGGSFSSGGARPLPALGGFGYKGGKDKLASASLNKAVAETAAKQMRNIASSNKDQNTAFKYNWETIKEAYTGVKSSCFKEGDFRH